MGTSQFAVPALSLLLEQQYPIVGVVTQPDRPKGRGRTLQPSPVKHFALTRNLPLFQPDRVRDDIFLAKFRQLSPDLVVLAAYGQLLPKEIIEHPHISCLNIHPSLLPKYRGAAPINWAIINGEKTTGLTIMHMTEELDAGDIILQEEIPIEADENFDRLHDRLAHRGAELLILAVEQITSGSAKLIPQDASAATFAPSLKKDNGLLRWEQGVDSIVNLIRGLSSYPGAYTVLDGKKLKILRASSAEAVTGKTPGTIVIHDGINMSVAAGNGYVHLQDVQMENKERMAVGDFLRGYHIESGSMLR